MSHRSWRSTKRVAAAVAAAAVGASLFALPASPAGAITPITTGLRIEGSNRYATSAALATMYVAERTVEEWGGNLVLAAGGNFPDALSAASIASVKDAPVLLVPSEGGLPTSIRDWLLVNRGTIQAEATPSITVIGGEAAVPAATVTEILALLNGGLTTPKVTSTRLSGADRYSTSAAVANATGVLDAADTAILVSGERFADAVSVAPLAFAKGWPIILTPELALNASAKAVLTAFRTASSEDKLIIVGGPSVVSYGIEEQLVLEGFKYSNITRIAGPDRYDTSLLLNVAMLNPSSPAYAGPQYDGSHVALVTGENFADAVAAAPYLAAQTGYWVPARAPGSGDRTPFVALGRPGIHLQLTRTNELSPAASTLMSTLANSYYAPGPQKLYAIGGTSAVSANTLNAAVAAAKSTDMVGTMTCLEGYETVSITFPSWIDSTEQLSLTDGDIAINGASNLGSWPTGLGDPSRFSDLDRTVSFDLDGSLAAGDVVTFGGNLPVNSDYKRTLSAPSCTVADDATGPALTITAVSNSAGTFFVSSNEPLVGLDATDFTLTGLGSGTTVSAVSPISLAVPNTLFVATLSAAATTGGVIALGAGVATDMASNPNAAASTTITTDSTAPTFSLSATATPIFAATVSAGGVTLSAAFPGAYAGTSGNGWKLSVVNQRGLVLPTVTADATAKTVTITADTRYTDAADVVQFVANRGLLPDWHMEGAGALTATTTPGTTTGGTDHVLVLMQANEFMQTGDLTSVVATLNGVPLASPTGLMLDGERSLYVTTFSTTTLGSLSLTWPGALDIAGNIAYGTITTAIVPCEGDDCVYLT